MDRLYFKLYNRHSSTSLALYQGLALCLFGDVIYRGLKYGLYDGLEPVLLDVIGADKTALIFFANWVLGSVIAAAVGTFLMPLDTVRRLMIMDTNSQERPYSQEVITLIFLNQRLIENHKKQPKYRSAFHCTAVLLEQKGPLELWRGIFVLLHQKF